MVEEWKSVVGFENYEVSNLGRVRSKPREGTKGGIIQQFIVNNYPKVKVYKDGVSYFLFTHRVVAMAFIPNVDNKPQINHKNGKKHDNRVCNLEWCTSSENIEHSIITGLRKCKKVGQFKNGVLIKEYLNCLRASKETGIKYPNIWYVLNGRNKTSGGYEWKYIN